MRGYRPLPIVSDATKKKRRLEEGGSPACLVLRSPANFVAQLTIMSPFWPTFAQLQTDDTPFCVVTVVDTLGSAPADRGAKMLVTSGGLRAGTVGGGKVEARALLEARRMLESGASEPMFTNWNLQTDLKMTCGGVVRLFFETYSLARWPIAIFGAGHVAQALVRALLPLPCRLSCLDTRAPWIEQLPDDPKLNRVLTSDLAGQIETLSDNAFVVLMTMGHATDLPVLRVALKRPFPYIGVIGSKTKGAAMRKTLAEEGFSEAECARFFCPLGLPIGTNHVGEIAISIAAQLLMERDQSMESKRKRR